ncbi:MAG: hypothetical protein JWQ38_3759, partial [Flavipsychrobacter sp.]|nr:hypothetical protein [Flavipsychrobacter sp.]
YREVPGTNGYKVPYKISESTPGQGGITEKVTSVEVNKGIPDSDFN